MLDGSDKNRPVRVQSWQEQANALFSPYAPNGARRHLWRWECTIRSPAPLTKPPDGGFFNGHAMPR